MFLRIFIINQTLKYYFLRNYILRYAHCRKYNIPWIKHSQTILCSQPRSQLRFINAKGCKNTYSKFTLYRLKLICTNTQSQLAGTVTTRLEGEKSQSLSLSKAAIGSYSQWHRSHDLAVLRSITAWR